jgi:predicted HicB family RNase H-like nuclease
VESDTLEYKGYRGSVRYSAEDRVLHGRILGIDDVVNFEGADVDELERGFHDAVDDYLALCEKVGRVPDREYSGRIPLRIEPDLHRRVAIAADSESKSVNGWIAERLEEAAVKETPPVGSYHDALDRTARRTTRGGKKLAREVSKRGARRKRP